MSRVDRIHGKKNRNKKRRVLQVFIGVILALVIIIGSSLLYMIFSIGLIQDPTGLIKAQDQFENNKVNILIVGSDIRPEDKNSRSDTLIVGSFDFEEGIVNLLSIPRDIRIPIFGYGKDKINHAYAYGGLALTKKTVEDFLEIKIDRTIEINFDSFKNVIDKIGGVCIDVEQNMYHPEEGINLLAGQQILNGVDSLAYVRFRGTSTGDLGRVERQQKFLKALAFGVKNKANVFQQAGILVNILGKIKTNITFQEAVYILNKFNKYMNSDNFDISTWTLQGIPRTIDGVFYLIPKDCSNNKSRDFLRGKLFAVTDPNDSKKKILVTVEEEAQIKAGTFSCSTRNNSANSNNNSNSSNCNSY